MPIRLIALLVLVAQTQGARPAREVKEAFLKLLDRPKVDLDARIQAAPPAGGLVEERGSFASEKKRSGEVERVPFLIVRPEKVEGRVPAVVVLHGTGGTKESQRGWMEGVARKGMIGLAIDARYHGERAPGAKGAAAYNEAITRAWKARPEAQEHPFYYDTAWDLWRTVDYLLTRTDVDPKRIGMIGFSMGGIQTWLAASVDDRVAVAVPAIAAQSFRWSLENDKWQGRARTIAAAHEAAARDLGEPAVNQKVCRALWTKVVPGILDDFDCPSLIRLFAGRPLLLLSGELDANCPVEGARLAFAAAEEAYKAAGCPDKLKVMVAAGVGHKVTDEQHQAARDWLTRWLKE